MAIVRDQMPTMPRFVHESWRRAQNRRLDPARDAASIAFDRGELVEYRQEHPLSLALPVFERLLFEHARHAELIVAIGDHHGRLLWVDGAANPRRGAERMLFVEGADWSEDAVGTAAPGTALALERPVQVRGEEHYLHVVHPWNCSAVPIRDPITGRVIGVVDVTGGEQAAAPYTLPLLEAAVAAVEAELQVRGLQRIESQRRPATSRVGGTVVRGMRIEQHPSQTAAGTLHVLGRDRALLEYGSRSAELSVRHSEIMLLLAANPGGLTAEALATALYENSRRTVTLRAEMVRLRRVLAEIDPALVPLNRPYHFAAPLDTDLARVLSLLERGAHRAALAAYPGSVLPPSAAAAIDELRRWVSGRLRDALLSDASVDALLSYAELPEAADDVEVWNACLRMLPSKSPRRARVVAELERIETHLEL